MTAHPHPSPSPTGSAAPRWQLIADELGADISAGRLAPGQRLPNEAQLAERFGVNRHTLRQALQALARQGFVQARQGSGTYVRELVLDYALQRRTRLTQSLAAAGEQAKRELLASRIEPAGAWAAELGLARSDSIELLITRSSVRGRPVGVSTAAYPLPRLAGMAEAFARLGSITAALQSLGVADYTRQRSVVSARLPEAHEADALARAPTQPLLEVVYLNVDAQGRPVEAGRTVFAADAVQLSVNAADWGQP
ncbi:phosphonate metabolism transcriptional regulator PhnF [Paucibacter sp. APW11]|uniref:Phosphonate metabolism transcriptional regulator PhnF n=1 Tax=Roseateles aquae TaxID=3077235 RepID=A0ABU3PIR9_9BURK|nr:phosphonate metabolism transcriptional regulator PhnF [Paucibacter sp. APW11]MDT9002262.1 phosphonate metabolism transcriptional regulator PhnF [Paucibacter sp. APW11]